MGVYIKDLKKPKGCYECPIAKSYLDCLMEKKYVCPIGHTDDCPMIEVDENDPMEAETNRRTLNDIKSGKGLSPIKMDERRTK